MLGLTLLVVPPHVLSPSADALVSRDNQLKLPGWRNKRRRAVRGADRGELARSASDPPGATFVRFVKFRALAWAARLRRSR
jgi:hypothetical protein